MPIKYDSSGLIVEEKSKPTYGAKEAGCWFDNCRGIYQGEAIIEEAIAHGFVIEDPENLLGPCRRYSDALDPQFYHDLTEESEEHMQQFAADGYAFGYSESGDWGLWPIEEEG